MKYVFSSIESGSVSGDGMIGTVSLAMAGGSTVTIDCDQAGIEDLVTAFIQTALAMGSQQGLDPAPPMQGVTPVVLPTSGMGAMLGPQGHALLVFRMGCLDLGFQIENSQMIPIGQRLVQLGGQLGSEPRQMQ